MPVLVWACLTPLCWSGRPHLVPAPWHVAWVGGWLQPEWTDMLFLSAYLRILRPEVPRVVLCGTPAANGYTNCQRLKWTMAIGAAFVFDEQRRPVNPGCANMSEFVEVRPEAAGSAPPQTWTRWAFFPPRSGPPERIPMLHWQGACKLQGRQFYAQHFQKHGLLPDLTAQPAEAQSQEGAAGRPNTAPAAAAAVAAAATSGPGVAAPQKVAAAAGAGGGAPPGAGAGREPVVARGSGQTAGAAAQPGAAEVVGQPAATRGAAASPAATQPAGGAAEPAVLPAAGGEAAQQAVTQAAGQAGQQAAAQLGAGAAGPAVLPVAGGAAARQAAARPGAEAAQQAATQAGT